MADSNLTRGRLKNVLFLSAGLTPEKEAEACAVNWAVFSGACDRCRYLRLCSSGLAANLPSDAACVKEKERILNEKVIQREGGEGMTKRAKRFRKMLMSEGIGRNAANYLVKREVERT